MEVCGICGQQFSRGHAKKHGMSPKEYRKKFKPVHIEPWVKDVLVRKGADKPREETAEKKHHASSKIPVVKLPVREKKPKKLQTNRKVTISKLGTPIKLLRWLDDEVANGRATHDEVAEVLLQVLRRDDTRVKTVTAAISLMHIQRLLRSSEAVGRIEDELFKQSRVTAARTTELIAMLQLINQQQERALQFLTQVYQEGGPLDSSVPSAPILVDQSNKTIVYMQDSGEAPGPPTPEERERVAQACNRIFSILRQRRHNSGVEIEPIVIEKKDDGPTKSTARRSKKKGQ